MKKNVRKNHHSHSKRKRDWLCARASIKVLKHLIRIALKRCAIMEKKSQTHSHLSQSVRMTPKMAINHNLVNDLNSRILWLYLSLIWIWFYVWALSSLPFCDFVELISFCMRLFDSEMGCGFPYKFSGLFFVHSHVSNKQKHDEQKRKKRCR